MFPGFSITPENMQKTPLDSNGLPTLKFPTMQNVLKKQPFHYLQADNNEKL